MRNVEIKAFPISKSCVDESQVKEWLEYIGVDNYDVPKDIPDSSLLCGLAAKRCYMSFEPGLNPNVNKVRKDWTNYFNNILDSGHGSVLEHASWTWAIENVSRVFTGEMNRHRAGVAISEGSMRYIRYNDIPFWKPLSLRNDTELADMNITGSLDETDKSIDLKKKKTFDVFKEVFSYVENKYKYLVDDVWDMDNMTKFSVKKKITSCLRRLIPMGVATGGVWTINLRSIRHILATRSDPAAEEEIAYVWTMIGKRMVESEPHILGDFKQDDQGFWTPSHHKI